MPSIPRPCTRRWVVAESSRRRGRRTRRANLAVFETERGELAAHVVQIEPQLAGREALALLLLVRDALLRCLGDRCGFCAADAYDSVVIRDDGIAGLDTLAGADHGHVHAAQARL